MTRFPRRRLVIVSGLTTLLTLSACEQPDAPPNVGLGQLAFASDRLG